MKEILERIVEKVSIIESDGKKLPSGVLCRVSYPICNIGELNRNKRVYERAVWDKVFNDPDIQEKLRTRSLLGHAEHPKDTSQSSTEKVSHVVNRIWEEQGKVRTEIDVLDTPYGRICDTLLRAGCGLGVSTRAEGELEKQSNESGEYYRVIPEAYALKTIDFTADPSTYGAYPENVERDLVGQIKKGVDDSKINRDFAVNMLESLTGKEAKSILESIKMDKQHKDCKCKTSEKKCNHGCDHDKVKEGFAPPSAGIAYEKQDMDKDFEVLENIIVTGETGDTVSFNIDGRSYEYFGVTPPITDKFKKMLAHGAKFNALHWLNKMVPKDKRYRIEGEGSSLKRVPIQPASEFFGTEGGDLSRECKEKVSESKPRSMDFETMYAEMQKAWDNFGTENEKKALTESKTVLDIQHTLTKFVLESKKESALVRAERDKLLEMIQESEDKFVEDIMKLTEQVEAFKSAEPVKMESLGKKIQECKDLQEKLSKLEASVKQFANEKAAFGEKLVEEVKKIYEAKIDELKKYYETQLAEAKETLFQKTVVDAKLKSSGLKLPENAMLVLRQCKTDEEVDTLLSDFRHALKESMLHGNKPEKVDLDIQREPQDSTMVQTSRLIRGMK